MRIGTILRASLTAAGVLALTGTSALAAGKAPLVQNESASAVTQTTAILNATINPKGEDTQYDFQYVSAAAYKPGALDPYESGVSTEGADAGKESGEVVVGQQIGGLEPDTTYHYRILATNSGGTVEGEDETFTTLPLFPPTASTGAASDVTQSEATLSGTIDAQGVPTNYEFDIGADTSYGTRIFGDAGSAAGAQPHVVSIQDLAAGVTYHYRIIATNVYGTTYGADVVFTTPAYPSSLLTAPAVAPLIPTPLIGSAVITKTTAKHAAQTTRNKQRLEKRKKELKRLARKARKAASSRRRSGL